MSRLVNEIVKKVMKNLMMEADFKIGDSIKIPGSEAMGRKILRLKYGVDPNDFDYIGDGKMGKFIYKVKPKKSRPSTKKPKFKSQDLGRKEGETEQEYLERVREINPKFAEQEGEIQGEEWRPIENKGRFFRGEADFSKDFEVSNMGRIRVIDYADPMHSVITSGYDAPGKKARQLTLRIEGMRTTPPIHTLVADAWLPEPPGGIENYYVEHIDGNYHNNRADNLRYAPKKGRAARKAAMMNNAEPEAPLAESIRRIIRESVKKALNENSNTHQYQIVAYLIDPNADWQREGLSSDDYEESKRDFEFLSNLNCKLNKQAINIFRKYRINDGAVEEHNSEEPFIMDIDGDGIYLLKRIN